MQAPCRAPHRSVLRAGAPQQGAERHAMTGETASRSMDAALPPSRAEADAILRAVLVDTLTLDEEQVADFENDSGLFGHLPELDSMAVATLLTEIEDRFAFTIDDDEVDGEMLETFGALLAFIEMKLVTD